MFDLPSQQIPRDVTRKTAYRSGYMWGLVDAGAVILSQIRHYTDKVASGWMDYVLGLTRRRAAHGNAIIKTHGRVERERPMLRKTMIVLAAAAALCGGLTDDALALATGHNGWDGLGDGVGHPILSQKTPKRYVAPTKPRIRKSFSVGRVRSKFLPAKESLRMWPRAVWHPQTP